MTTFAADLSRPVMIDCCKDGTITYRLKKEKPFNGVALPMMSVDTVEEAEQLQLHFCKLQYKSHDLMPGRPWYRIWDFSGKIEDVLRLGEQFADAYSMMRERKV